MIWKVGGEIRRLPASIETPGLVLEKAYNEIAVFVSDIIGLV